MTTGPAEQSARPGPLVTSADRLERQFLELGHGSRLQLVAADQRQRRDDTERRRSTAPTVKAVVKPSTSATGSAVPLGDRVRGLRVAIADRIAMPSAPPICCEVLIRPDARPASAGLDPGQRGDRDRHEREADADADQQEARQQVAHVAAVRRRSG